jgi:hypothetical protein
VADAQTIAITDLGADGAVDVMHPAEGALDDQAVALSVGKHQRQYAARLMLCFGHVHALPSPLWVPGPERRCSFLRWVRQTAYVHDGPALTGLEIR